MSEYPSMYDAAIEYAKKGFAVFPLKYRDKVPLTRNGCKDATTDAAQIKAWWQKYPNANIGLATGSVSQNVFVIDLDIDEDRGIDGYHSLEDWQREHGDFPETWTAITGRGGYHLYYRGNGRIKNRAGIIDGVDIRGNGGYLEKEAGEKIDLLFGAPVSESFFKITSPFTVLESGETFAEQIITVIGGIIEKELDAREKAQQKRIKKYTDKYAKKEVAEA